MLLYLDDSIGDLVVSGVVSDGDSDAIQMLALSHRYGKNFLIASRMTLRRLASFPGLTDSARGVFLGLYNSYSFSSNLSSLTGICCRVFYQECKTDIDDFDVVIDVSISEVTSKNIADPVRVFIEDISDKVVIDAVCQRVLQDRNINGVVLSADYQNGGGDNIAKNFLHSVEAGRLSVCLVDSDRRYPGAPPKQTARKISKVCADLNMDMHLHVLGVHELENLVPPEVYSKSAKTDAQQRAMTILEEKGRVFPDVYLYFDYKKGIKVCATSKCQYMKRYWGDVSACKSCGEPGVDPCYVIPPYGVSEDLRVLIGDKRQYVSACEALRDSWRAVFDFLFGWCVAPVPVRV